MGPYVRIFPLWASVSPPVNKYMEFGDVSGVLVQTVSESQPASVGKEKIKERADGGGHPSGSPEKHRGLTCAFSQSLFLSLLFTLLYGCVSVSVSRSLSLSFSPFSPPFSTSGAATFFLSQRAPPSPAWSPNSFQMCLWNSSTITAETGRKCLAL